MSYPFLGKVVISFAQKINEGNYSFILQVIPKILINLAFIRHRNTFEFRPNTKKPMISLVNLFNFIWMN